MIIFLLLVTEILVQVAEAKHVDSDQMLYSASQIKVYTGCKAPFQGILTINILEVSALILRTNVKLKQD